MTRSRAIVDRDQGLPDLDRDRSVLSGTGWNLVGQLAGLVAAVVAAPVIIQGLGASRFGLLAIAWLLVGYFGLLDLGLGRAVTRDFSRRIADHDLRDAPLHLWTATWGLLGLGLIGTTIMGCIGAPVLANIIKMPASMDQETQTAIMVLALAIPFVTVSSGFMGVLASWQRFDAINAAMIPMSVLMYIGPAVCALFSDSLIPAVVTIVLARGVGCAILIAASLHLDPSIRKPVRPSLRVLKHQVSYGGWLTVSNVLGSGILYLDRLVIGVVLSASAVAVYAAPYAMASKLLVFPVALAPVLFPIFASDDGSGRQRSWRLASQGATITILVLLPASGVLVALAPEIIGLWLGPRFLPDSALVLQFLAIGVFMNGPAWPAVTYLQATGRQRWPAYVYAAELVPFVAGVWLAARQWGAPGVAAAWATRAGIDSLVFLALSSRGLDVLRRSRRSIALGIVAGGLGLLATTYASSVGWRCAAVGSLSLAVGYMQWRQLPKSLRAAVTEVARTLLALPR